MNETADQAPAIVTAEDSPPRAAPDLGEFLASHGGPFFELQEQLKLLRHNALRVGPRAVLFVALAWGVPFLLGLPRSFSLDHGQASYLADLGVWAKFFIGIAGRATSRKRIECEAIPARARSDLGTDGNSGSRGDRIFLAPGARFHVGGASVAKHNLNEGLTTGTLSTVMSGWLALVISVFAYPLAAFSPPLSRLKEQGLSLLGAQATNFCRSAERKAIGRNVFAAAAPEPEVELSDPGKYYDATRKLSTVLVNRASVVPVAAAALIPFAVVVLRCCHTRMSCPS